MLKTLVNPAPDEVDAADGVRLVFSGREGLLRFAGDRSSAADPAAFRAESVSTEYAGVMVSRVRASECRLDRGGPRSAIAAGVELGLLLDGSVVVTQADAVSTWSAGELMVWSTGTEVTVAAGTATQAIWLFVPAERLPGRMQDSSALPRGPLPETRLSASVAAFLRRLAAGPAVGQGPDRVYLARAVAELAVAVIAEAMGDELPDDRAAALRVRVRDHIEQHLGDQGLGPQQIASALGVSVRYVHRVFNTEGETVARFIREQRLDAIARVLRAEQRPQRVGALAERFGFSGRDHLTRAFRQRFGMTLREYQDAAALESPAVLGGTRLLV